MSAGSVPDTAELAARLASPAFQRRQVAARLAARIGHLLRMERLASGYSVEELAARVRQRPDFVTAIERGEKPSACIGRVGELFGGLGLEFLPSLELLPAKRIEAGTDETAKQAQPEGREPGDAALSGGIRPETIAKEQSE